MNSELTSSHPPRPTTTINPPRRDLRYASFPTYHMPLLALLDTLCGGPHNLGRTSDCPQSLRAQEMQRGRLPRSPKTGWVLPAAWNAAGRDGSRGDVPRQVGSSRRYKECL